MTGPGVPSGPGVPGGPISLPQASHVTAYQTHVFAPPVTGAPVKKSKLANTPSSASVGGQGSNGSVLTMGMCLIRLKIPDYSNMIPTQQPPVVSSLGPQALEVAVIHLPMHLGSEYVVSAVSLVVIKKASVLRSGVRVLKALGPCAIGKKNSYGP